jgi:hypothetical protein
MAVRLLALCVGRSLPPSETHGTHILILYLHLLLYLRVSSLNAYGRMNCSFHKNLKCPFKGNMHDFIIPELIGDLWRYYIPH